MFTRPSTLDELGDDPIVRRTVARLRLSVIAVVVGVALCLLVGAFAARHAYEDGLVAGALTNTAAIEAKRASQQAKAVAQRSQVPRTAREKQAVRKARAARAAARTKATSAAEKARRGPSMAVFAILTLGFLGLVFSLFAIVRRPYESAREQAVDTARAAKTLAENTLETFAALNATVEAKDRYTAGHGLRVTLVSLLIGQELGLEERELDLLRHAATFHDIGKIAVPDEVLQKPGRLTDAEFEAMKIHPVESARICGKLAQLRDAVPAIRSHHERFDGRGYPDGLQGVDIPLGARIIAVADSWDAITSDRPYRRGQPAAVALDEIRRVAGTQFDPRVVTAFIEVLAKDPWMFGLTPEDVKRTPSAPGRRVEQPSRASEQLATPDDELAARVTQLVSPDQERAVRHDDDEIDWSGGVDLPGEEPRPA